MNTSESGDPLTTATTQAATVEAEDKAALLDKQKQRRRVRDSQLRLPISSNHWPILYSSHYNITCFGLERLHPFDSTKWGKVFKICQGKFFFEFRVS